MSDCTDAKSIFHSSSNRLRDVSDSDGRERLKQELFETLLYGSDPDAWISIAERLTPRRNHLSVVPTS